MGMPLGPISEAAGGGRLNGIVRGRAQVPGDFRGGGDRQVGVWIGRRIAEPQAIHQAADSVEGLGDLLVLIIVIMFVDLPESPFSGEA